MDFFLFGTFFLTFLLVYFIQKKDIVSPSVLFSLSFVASGLVFSLNSLIWNYELSQKTIIVIVLGIITLAAGSLLVNLFHSQGIQKRPSVLINIRKEDSTLMVVFCSIYIILRVLDVYTTSGSLNIFGGGLGDFRDLSQETSFYGKLVKLVDPVCYSACILCMLSNALNKKAKINKKATYTPIILYFIGSVLSSSRIGMIYIFLTLIVVSLIAERLYKEDGKSNFKSHITMLVYLLLIVVLFFALGFLTGKSQNQVSLADNISLYAASSLAAFDDFLLSFRYDSSQFGSETFLGLSNFLNWFGLKSSAMAEKYTEYVALGDMSHATNVYSCFKPYLHDFNYSGLYLILFFEGVILQIWYNRANKRITQGRVSWMVFYAYLAPYIMLSAIAERFFACILTTTTLLFAISLYWWTKRIKIRIIDNE